MTARKSVRSTAKSAPRKARTTRSAPAKRAPAAKAKAAARPARKLAAPAHKPAATARKPARPAASRAAANGVEFPSAIGTITEHLDFTTHDPDALRRFYGDVLGMRAEADGAPGAFRVRLNAGASVAFRPPAPGPPEQWRPPREPVMVFVVADADRAYETLRARGVAFDTQPADLSWGARGALLRDPEGRMMWIVHPLREA